MAIFQKRGDWMHESVMENERNIVPQDSLRKKPKFSDSALPHTMKAWILKEHGYALREVDESMRSVELADSEDGVQK